MRNIRTTNRGNYAITDDTRSMRDMGIRKKSIKKYNTLGGSQIDAGISVSKTIAK